MMPATVLAYFQLGQFLMLVMVFSWVYATFAFLSICAVMGPRGTFGQLRISSLLRKCGVCRVKPDSSNTSQTHTELDNVRLPATDPPPQDFGVTTPL